ncbi:MAG: hypothetical protein A3B38_01020 [Candidatus Levybacteria bacterium RIFCSPLOWO2_01_FULL_36_13]|nr:MAG: hypothetical protein A2684_02260 [Candidatus Levybacteria bacterium RIFCSPHIGHO2_01_FULL_36_15b]OGH35468.1 MAG: hypothetical protein A3B38_01020 [Candidatus Levybacteria bacterium RIFCSPLOWO2_01_FULL_36_13]
MNNCAFCTDEIRKRAIEEGKYSVVFLSNPRLAYGHLLIVSKRHTEKLMDLAPEEKEEIMGFLTKYQEKVVKTISEGTVIMTNYKPYKPNSRTRVNHLHFHIIPVNKDDNYETSVAKTRVPYTDLSKEEELRVLKLLK